MSEPIGPDLFRHLTGVSDPTMSPDGGRCAYVLSWVDAATSENRSRIYQVRVADDAPPPDPLPFTRGDSDSHPRYSPDGARLAFLRPDDSPDAHRQVWLMPADGGEAAQLTSLPSGVREFAWAPDATRLVVVADVEPDDSLAPNSDAAHPDAPETRPGESQATKPRTDELRTDELRPDEPRPDEPRPREMRRIRYRHDAIGWRGDSHFHLFLVDAHTGEATQVTHGDWDDMAPAWSQDGQRIAFISGRAASRDISATNEVYVLTIDHAGQALQEPKLWSQGLTDAAAVAWSPDGQRLLAAGGEDDGLTTLWQSYLYVLEENQPPRRLTDDGIRPCIGYPGIYPTLELRWTRGKDGGNDQVVFLADAAGQTRLYSLDVPDGPLNSETSGKPATQPAPLTDGGELLSGIAIDATAERVALVASGPAAPSDLHLAIRHGRQRRRLSAHNDAWLQGHRPVPMQKFSIAKADWDIECRLYHPPGFDPALKYPLVLEIHGGPNGAFYDSFVPWHQVLAGAGYLTLAANPRGSSTYGAKFVNAVLGDWGGKDYEDLMAAVDAVCQRDYVDTNRLGIHGYSYGGYMTTWTIGHTGRFRAAVAGAPCIDLWSMYGTSDIAASFGESQWADRPGGGMPISRPLANELAEGVDGLAYRLLQRSPITFAPQVETPVLLLHGEADARCPIGQSEQYFQVMKRLGKEVEMARFPGCGHGFLRVGHVALRQAYLERMLDWFRRWL